MNKEVKLVLIFAAVIVVSVSTITFIKQYIAVMQLERLNAPLVEVSEEAPGQTDQDTLVHQPNQQHNQVLQFLQEDHRRQKQTAEARLMEAINVQAESEEMLSCPEDSDTEQCS